MIFVKTFKGTSVTLKVSAIPFRIKKLVLCLFLI